jgi:diguanylate cyclase (GGDEF)-like protein/PAS domain S-box-containing protein
MELGRLEDAGAVELGAEARAHDLLDFGFLVGDGSRILHANGAAGRLFGRSPEDLLLLGVVRDLLHPEDEHRIAQTVEDRRATGRAVPDRFTSRIVRPDGSTVVVELWVKAEVHGDQVRTYTMIHEVGGEWAVRDGLAQLALTDPLTQLPNRLALDEHLRLALARLDRHPGRGMLVFLDVDRLKQVNDRTGHAGGDLVLRTFAARLAGALRSGDTAARMGGDEFIALLPELDDTDPIEIVERIRAETTFDLEIDGEVIEVSASIGAVTLDDPDASRSELIARADDRMYHEKRQRRAGR